jgi:stress-induced morphogen
MSMLSGVRGRMMAAARRPLGRAWLSSSADGSGTQAEQAMHTALQTHLQAVHVKVTDVSGGCGSMFDVEVASPQFAGQSRVKQHRMVNEVL